jgi:uncharacterized membrane protein
VTLEPPPSTTPASSTGLSPALGAVLAYGAWWVSGLLFWWAEERDPFIRFHAAQAIVAFGIIALLIAGFAGLALVSLSVLPAAFVPFLYAAGATWAGGMLLWAAAIWNAAKGRVWHMPLVGPLAARMAGPRC